MRCSGGDTVLQESDKHGGTRAVRDRCPKCGAVSPWRPILEGGPLVRIHVNRHIIDRNRKKDRNDPALSVIRSGSTTHGHEVKILGSSIVVQADGVRRKPLKCGAKVWIETYSDVEVI